MEIRAGFHTKVFMGLHALLSLGAEHEPGMLLDG
jgi:hypothetical protein